MTGSCRLHRLLGLAGAAAVLLTGCVVVNNGQDVPRMPHGMRYHYSTLTCSAPSSLPGRRVRVTLADMGMTRMMHGAAPMGAHMRLRVSPRTVPAGRVTLVAANIGWRTHELVVLPLAGGAVAGRRTPGANGRISEAGALGEASRSCRAGTGEGIDAGTVGWSTLTLRPGRYELVCNLRNHYADGMYDVLVVR